MKRISHCLIPAISMLCLGAVPVFASDGSSPDGSFFNRIPPYVYLIVGIVLLAAIIVIIASMKKAPGASETDSLTGMGSRKYLKGCFERSNPIYRQHCCCAYIALNITEFEAHYGKEKAQTLEKHTAGVIMNSLGDYDYSARFEDGVFGLILRLQDKANVKQRLNSLVDSLNKYENELVGCHCVPFRVGLYTLESEDETFDGAFTNAKLGYIYAEENQVSFYVCTKELLRSEASKSRLKNKLNLAIDAKQFDMFLQFIYNVKEGRFTGAEVLSRWNSPDEGFLMPGYYINDMRSTGVIVKFDFYMLEKVCALLEEWSKDEKFRDLRLSCNLTRVTISVGDFVERFNAIVKKYDFDHDKLVLEITEDALVDNMATAYRNIVACKNEGFSIAIDDFGAGHSSVSDLCDYPVDTIKIDRDIIVKSTAARGGALLHGLIDLAHSLGIIVVCEGVETEDQRASVLKNECDFIQGYYYSYVFPVGEGQEYYLDSLAKAE